MKRETSLPAPNVIGALRNHSSEGVAEVMKHIGQKVGPLHRRMLDSGNS